MRIGIALAILTGARFLDFPPAIAFAVGLAWSIAIVWLALVTLLLTGSRIVFWTNSARADSGSLGLGR